MDETIIEKVANDERYYYLAWSVLHYFTFNPNRTILDFHTAVKDYNVSIEWYTLMQIVNKFEEKRLLWMTVWGGSQDNSGYRGTNKTLVDVNSNKEQIADELNCICFGFKYIYESRKKNVKHLVGINIKTGDQDGGTCYLWGDLIFTAKHCLTDMKEISIEGLDDSVLDNCLVYFPKNEYLDVAAIVIKKAQAKPFYKDDAHVLDEILVCGYPNIPGFESFLTTEKGIISSVGTKSPSGTVGDVAAIGNHYLQKSELMLITAKIRGGNSGGPIFNKNGSFIGVVTSTPGYDQNHEDDLGYGIAIPFQTIEKELIDSNIVVDCVSFRRESKWSIN